jgi:hypothetical protein
MSPAVTAKKISHFVSADNFVGRRRPLLAEVIRCSSTQRGDNQAWFISRWTLRGEVRRRTYDDWTEFSKATQAYIRRRNRDRHDPRILELENRRKVA